VTGVGASEAAVILGVSRFKSPFSLYHEKLGLEAASAAETEAAEWGLALEEPISKRFERETGRPVYAPPPHSFYIHDELPWMIASLDRITTVDKERASELTAIPLEIKTADASLRAEWKDDIPLAYMIQVQHQIAVMGCEQAALAALVGGNTFFWTDIRRDEEFIKILIDQEQEFWQRCIDHRPPEVDASKATSEALRKLYQRDTGEIVMLPPEALDWASDLEAAKAELKAAEEKERLAKNRLIAAIGDATAGQLPNGVIFTYKAQTKAEHIVKASTFRVLRQKAGAKGDQ